jgi:SpoVK/Ycf46/Vps4 family AAA+-type ATPase
VTVANGEFDTKKLFLPQSKRLYVLEEIDAISDIVKKRVPVIINTMESQRELSIQDCENYSLFKPINNDINTTSKPSINNDINTSIYPKSEIAEELEDELTLGGILTVLDGNLEVYSRMLIITSNHPETIDDALLRPGRIDLQVKFSKCDKKCIRDMYYSFFTKEPPELLLSFDGSPAELQQKLLSMYHAML